MPELPIFKIQKENKEIPTFKRMPITLQAEIHGTNFAQIRRNNNQKMQNSPTASTPTPRLSSFEAERNKNRPVKHDATKESTRSQQEK